MARSSKLVPIRYVGPFDVVEIAETGLTVERGHVVEVAEWLAGRAPDGDDAGAGLLAQVGNWQPATGVEPVKSNTPASAPVDPKE